MERLSNYTDDDRRRLCRSHGIDPSQHCCLDMAWFISEPVEHESQGKNPTMLWIQCWNEYRINIPRNGNTSIPVRFCPWCSARLPESLRERWYQTLYNLGFHDPGNDKIPEEYNTDAWWR